MPAPPRVYVIVLNYRGADDTVACLLSLEQLHVRHFEVLVVDNASGDDSLQRVSAAVNGRLSYPITFMQAERNDGFGAGNNLGLRAALARDDGTHYWLLNNDTVVLPLTLDALLNAALSDEAAGRRIGQYGSKLLYHGRPEIIQAVGGRYNRWLGITREIGYLQPDHGQFDAPPPSADILIGASLFVTDAFVRDVGLLAEDHFLYYEEHDWAARGRRRGWGLRIVPQSVIYHKQGVAIGARGGDRMHKSRLSDYCSIRGRLLITARYDPWCLPTVYAGLLGTIAMRIRRGQWSRIPMILALMFTFWRKIRLSAWQ